MAFCNNCGKEQSQDSNYCSSCGRPKQNESYPVSAAEPFSSGMAQNIAGMLTYLTFIPAVIFLLIRPYNKNPFVRFHAIQSILFTVVFVLITLMSLLLVSCLKFFSPALAYLVVAAEIMLKLLCFVLWIVCVIKAFGNDKVKLPIIGDLAERQAAQV